MSGPRADGAECAAPLPTPAPEAERARRVRSFVRREGRLTRAQARALEELWPRYGLELDAASALDAVFGRRASRTLEIGFGNGESLSALAAAHPRRDYLGIEVHRPGVGHLLLQLEALGLDNVRLWCADAMDVLERLPVACLDEVLLFFPDPWPKKRHHKRRLVQPAFVERVARVLAVGGRFHMATDWEDYAHHMLTVMEAADGFRNCSPSGDFVDRPDTRPVTRFERRGRARQHGVWDMIFERVPIEHS